MRIRVRNAGKPPAAITISCSPSSTSATSNVPSSAAWGIGEPIGFPDDERNSAKPWNAVPSGRRKRPRIEPRR